MKRKQTEIECAECTNTFIVKSTTKDPICFCPFCGEEVIVEDVNDDDEDLEEEDFDEDA